jgi:hypothetical protein
MSKGFTHAYSIGEPTKTMWMDTGGSKRFRHAYVIKPGQFDFSALKPYCERIIFVTDGYGDHVDSTRQQLHEGLANFDAEKDVIIPVGSAMVNVMAGAVIQEKLNASGKKNWNSFAMGIFLDGSYHFWRIHDNPSTESYEIILR